MKRVENQLKLVILGQIIVESEFLPPIHAVHRGEIRAELHHAEELTPLLRLQIINVQDKEQSNLISRFYRFWLESDRVLI